jgi:branched-chain amino acid aminotransferase
MPTHFDLTFRNIPSQNRLDVLERERRLADPGFGRYFTDHMASIEWDVNQGWHDARVEGFHNLSLSPATSVFHYAPEIFEGMKAYRWADGSLHLFRPELNARRFQHSARRMGLPELGAEDFIEAVSLLVAEDRDWVPAGRDQSLYIRPFMFANEAFFGVRSTQSAEFHVIASPSGDYFAGRMRPIHLWIEEQYARASAKGVGSAKTGGNYAASTLPLREAHDKGFDQVLFLDAETGRYVDEAGSMNVFFYTRDNVLLTPELSGAILDGVTRRSVMQLAQDRGVSVSEHRIAKADLLEGIKVGHITEAFAAGTAAVVTPIASFADETGRVFLPEAQDSFALAIRQELTDIQWGRVHDRHGWTRPIEA